MPVRRRLPVVLLLVSLVGLVAGCGDGKLKVYPVSGKVLYNNQPLKGVDVAFHPTDPKNDTGYPPHATTDDQGNFKLMTYLPDDGAPAGEFKVAVAFAVQSAEEGSDQAAKKIRFQVPERYQRKETSGIVVTVQPGENPLDPFKLEGPAR